MDSIEGLFTVEVKNLSELVAHIESNVELLKLRSFEMLYYAKCGPFTLGDIKFDIRIYPVGQQDMYCYVCLLSDAELVKKFASMTMYQKLASSSWEMCSNIMAEKEFKADGIGEGLGVPMACVETFPTSKLRSATKHCSLLFKLILRLIFDDSGKVPTKLNTPEQVVSPPDVETPIADQIQPKVCFSGLGTALLTEEFADVHFVINGQTFPAHRVVLAARSSVFQSEFVALQNDMCENDIFVSVQHVDALTFKCLLHFIYTDSLPSDFDEAISSQQRYRSLFIAAHLFKVEGLKIICEEKLTGAVIDGILSALDLINFHDCGLLKILQKVAI
ncbi:hypothetical protein LUZ61_008491 [Rhynchospora tenuis]|uniref:BTB domain-containing protein n=1 Tax=Rhynchospora tenuis TaxID=198213 RepID=A0AAD6EXH0_9POAL|nr:hypothetical protein LUZ61_008491 [Rhynchospora tenuis]